ncbi:hypothetical protein HMP0721_0827 [Pseudoramibacter alactolyticus ATCC 23263]|uniref:Uncharacterized protein n=1 Tax=Pseudoramibacter alactolyticus ATCC 23263 TaxID=887929 RepID=E6MFR6_9FIRM|nr:hypothetical protein HMP0721_0827 [Pseudoramibacter alactolyticus ATCC 23263]
MGDDNLAMIDSSEKQGHPNTWGFCTERKPLKKIPIKKPETTLLCGFRQFFKK